MLAKRYSAYGYATVHKGAKQWLGYGGNRLVPPTGGYLLGNGSRLYSPSAMRFYSPDILSPFGLGGVNTYAYCGGDPVGHSDPSGHFRLANVPRRLKDLFSSSKNRQADVFIGYHGTSAEAGQKMIKEGVRKDATSFFVTDRYESANHYAGLQQDGVVLKVMSNNLNKVINSSARGVKRETGINELKVDRPAFRSLKFSVASPSTEVSDFSRFMTQQERLESTIHQFIVNAVRRGS